MLFTGRRLRIYGVTGPGGGLGVLFLIGKGAHDINFRSPVKHVHELVYDSGLLAGGVHSAGLVVAKPRSGPPRGFVNIDEICVNDESGALVSL